jgi:electron transport complex protein RnfG
MKGGFIKDAIILFIITLVAGACLGGVYSLTKGPIDAANLAAKAEAWDQVMPGAATYDDKTITEDMVAAGNDTISGLGFGSVSIDEAVIALDSSNSNMGYVVTATSNEGFGGAVTVSVGIAADGTVLGIAFPSGLSETAGLGMKALEPDFYEQYSGKQVTEFTVTKDGDGASADEKINAISGATITSKAVTNAVNSALYFALNCVQ